MKNPTGKEKDSPCDKWLGSMITTPRYVNVVHGVTAELIEVSIVNPSIEDICLGCRMFEIHPGLTATK
jgi:hypothetical protein